MNDAVNVALDQVLRMSARREELDRMQGEAETAFVGAVASAYEAGVLSDMDLAGLYARVRPAALPGFARVWDGAVPRTAAWLRTAERTGSLADAWSGVRGETDTAPGAGTWSVYVLSDEAGWIVRTGCTNKLRRTLRKREEDTEGWASWSARKARDASHARQKASELRKLVAGSRPGLGVVA